jgi:hypothetical protein
MIDQTRATGWHRAVMVAARVGGRALPLAWRVRATRGATGFDEQRGALEAVARLLPAGARPVLTGDRFHGTPALIAWCRERGWGWRPRLKQDLLVVEGGGESTLAARFARGERPPSGVELTEKRATTHVATVHEPGHPEPWIVALSEPPTVHRAFDYGPRWGDRGHVQRLRDARFRSGGQPPPPPGALGPPHPRHGPGPVLGGPNRDVGCRPPRHPRRKKAPARQPRNLPRGLTSLFRRGIRCLRARLQRLAPPPPLWSAWLN